jgi:MFS family permease
MEDPPVSDPDHVAERPATFREVLASGEFRALFFANTFSALGDSMARAAVTALVYQRTESVLAASATFAISYLPWLGLGTVLAALAERYPYRRTMVVSDLARMVTIGLVAVPGMPVPVLLGLMFVTALFDPPFRAARSAQNPLILHGDRYVVGLSLLETASQIALISGYFLGGTLAAYSPRLTIAFDAATFGVSAFVVAMWVKYREAALRPERRSHLLRETGEGFAIVFGRPVLRSIAIVVFSGLLFSVVPEALGAPWADLLSDDWHERGWMQGLIMCSMPLGFVAGSLLISRFVAPATRQRLIRPFAIITPLALVGALFNPNVYGVALIAASSGFAVAAMLPAANGLFVQALPSEFRARAFGVMNSGVQVCQGAAVLTTGALANRFSLPMVVGLWGAAGVVLMILSSLTWPRPETIKQAIEDARHSNDEGDGPPPETSVPGAGETDGPSARRPSPRHEASGGGEPAGGVPALALGPGVPAYEHVGRHRRPDEPDTIDLRALLNGQPSGTAAAGGQEPVNGHAASSELPVIAGRSTINGDPADERAGADDDTRPLPVPSEQPPAAPGPAGPSKPGPQGPGRTRFSAASH